MYLFKSIKVIDSGRAIILRRKDGSSLRYHSTWLRDNANDPKTRDKNNGQRLISISDIPVNTYIKSASLDKKGKNTKISVKGRHDPCVGIRAVPIGEAMMSCVLLDHYLLNRAQRG